MKYYLQIILISFCIFCFLGMSNLSAKKMEKSNYQLGVEKYNSLQKNAKASREDWLEAAGYFQISYATKSSGNTASKSLYNLGSIYEKLGKQSEQKNDFFAAVDYYKRIFLKFPKNSLADDGLYAAARLSFYNLHDTESALNLLDILQSTYPSGDMMNKATKLRGFIGAHSVKQASNEKLKPQTNFYQKPKITEKTISKSKIKFKSSSVVEQLGLNIRTIVIDPGHGGKDPGAMANSLREKDITLKVARLLGSELTKRGFRVFYTRSSDRFISLDSRTMLANAKKADLFISIHCNAYKGDANGIETYYLSLSRTDVAIRVAARENGVSRRKLSEMQVILSDLMLNSKVGESKDLAGILQDNTIHNVRNMYKLMNKGVHSAFFYVLTGARMPAVLVELGYLTNKQDANQLKKNAYLKELAIGVANGVSAYKKKLAESVQ